jgi:hypothetical protein
MKIYELHIYLNLNTPDFGEPVLFEYSMLSGNDLSKKSYKYPFFSNNVDYGKLTDIQYMSYSEIIDLFFNKKTFINRFESIQETDQTYNETNIVKMLTLLFPTVFPTYNNIKKSSDEIAGSGTALNLFSGITNAFKIKRYSYLNYGSKKYTIVRSVWLNDVINNPIYRDLMNSVKGYYIAAQTEKNKILMNEKKKFFVESDKFTPKRIEEIQTKIKSIKDGISSSVRNSESIQIEQNINIINHVLSILPISNDVTDLKPSLLTINTLEPIMDEKLFFNIIEYFKILYNISDSLKTLLKIKEDYYDKGAIDIEINTHQKPEIVNKITKFAPYNNLVDKIKKFLIPTYKTSNSSLQTLIENYSINADNDNTMIQFVNTLFTNLSDLDMKKAIEKENKEKIVLNSEKLAEFDSLAHIDVTTKGDSICEIYLLMDVLEGEINDTNKSNLSCLMKSETLGNMTEKILNPRSNSYDLTRNRISSDITQKKGGRKKKTRRNNKGKKRTKKNRFLLV